ncbi:DUF6049 family protein [Pengzhenrongella frigida]|uniref:2-oxoglutarate dehydrogenase n=1 Tax=Pengzhenrongella frigida TaxID=1259133 RepID=A0A4Q5MZD2_9MICO|nr:DUF6049 family protein [Cellulomonas sp. HLT2-17]RYV51095.1 hypothetical protein EUA98_09950 [Cellulomonas sp. HLT2-17]
MNAHLRRARRPWPGPLLRGLLGTLLGAAVVLTGLVSTGSDALAEVGSATPSPTDEVPLELPVQVAVTAVSPQVLRPDGQLAVRATVTNRSDEAIAEPRATLRIRRFLISTRSAVEEWTGFGATDTAGTPVGQPVVLGAPLAPGASADVEFLVPAGDLLLSSAPAAWGPRGISVEVTDDGARVGLARTFTLWLPAEPEASVRVSVAVPFTGEALDAEAATEPTLPTDDTIERLADLLEITRDRPEVAWALDPAVLAGLAGPDAPPEASSDLSTAASDADARALGTGLGRAAAGRDVFTLPAFDPDLAALAHAGEQDVAATAVSLAGAAPLPLLGSPPRTDLAWPADEVPDHETVALAAQVGARTVIVGGDGLAALDLNYTSTGRATVPTAAGEVAALVADSTLTDLFTDPDSTSESDASETDPAAPTAATGDPAAQTTPATAAQRVLAETAIVARERPSDSRHLLIAPRRGWSPDVAVARAQLAALAEAPWVDLAPLATLIGTADPAVEREALPSEVTADRELTPSAISSLSSARADLTTFATLVPDPAALTAGADAAVLAPLSVAWRADEGGRADVVQEVATDLAARATGVSVVPGSVLSLISRSGFLPVGLRNELDQDVTLQVSLVPENRLLVVDGPETITVPANSETQARIPFHAVGSGDVRVEVTLLAPGGAPVSEPTSFTVRVRADWENVGTAVVAGVLGLGLLFGIGRTIRRGQTKTRGASPAQIAEIAEITGPPPEKS